MDHHCRDIPMRLDINHQPLHFDIYLSQVIDVPRTPSLEEKPYDFKLEIEALQRVDQIIERIKQEEERRNQALPNHSDNATINNGQNQQMNSNARELLEQSNPPFYDETVTMPTRALMSGLDFSSATNNSQFKDQQKQESSNMSIDLDPSIGNLHDNSNQVSGNLQTSARPCLNPTCPSETLLTPVRCFSQPVEANTSEAPSVAASASEVTPSTSTLSASILSTSTTNDCDSATNSKSNTSSNHCAIEMNNPQSETGNGRSLSTSSDTMIVEPKANRVNPCEFEEIHYNPFDHLELQTIDELRELDLVFQASYANQASKQ